MFSSPWYIIRLLHIHEYAHPSEISQLHIIYYNFGNTDTFTVGTKLKLNSVALARERTIPTERPPPVGEVSANFCG